MQAIPRTQEEIANLPSCPDVVNRALERSIKEVLHFSTISGAIGILASNAVKSRERLSEDEYLEHVYRPNARYRKDSMWLDYVNLSISRINDWMFGSSVNWHSDENVSWVVFSFSPEILAHPGVVFATTNNIYSSCHRGERLEGLNELFADRIVRWEGNEVSRVNAKTEWPTDRQAEVLYPGELSCEYVQCIYVQREEAVDTMHGAFPVLRQNVPVQLAPEVFL